MRKPATRERRRRKAKPAAVPEPVMPMWKRALAAALFLLGGGATAAWGIHDLSVWIDALSRGARVIETQSAMPGLPLLGIGVGALGPLFLIPASALPRSERVRDGIAIAILGTMLVGCALSLVGGPIVNTVMARNGYGRCDTSYGRRMTFVVWATMPPGGGPACGTAIRGTSLARHGAPASDPRSSGEAGRVNGATSG